MKKYILNLFPNEDKQPQEVLELAMLIGLYNFEQPEIEFINWLKNNLSDVCFLFFPIGKETSGGIHTYDVQFRDESKRVGTIQMAIM
jgi:hypothetical protein